jgi:hypothetical protein
MDASTTATSTITSLQALPSFHLIFSLKPRFTYALCRPLCPSVFFFFFPCASASQNIDQWALLSLPGLFHIIYLYGSIQPHHSSSPSIFLFVGPCSAISGLIRFFFRTGRLLSQLARLRVYSHGYISFKPPTTGGENEGGIQANHCAVLIKATDVTNCNTLPVVFSAPTRQHPIHVSMEPDPEWDALLSSRLDRNRSATVVLVACYSGRLLYFAATG